MEGSTNLWHVSLVASLNNVNLMFIEEPVLSEHLEEMVEIRRHCNIPIAAGERLFSRYDFKTSL